jgi:hypothetical protein
LVLTILVGTAGTTTDVSASPISSTAIAAGPCTFAKGMYGPPGQQFRAVFPSSPLQWIDRISDPGFVWTVCASVSKATGIF